MKKALILITAILGLSALALSGCTMIIGAGNVETRSFDFKDFNRVEVGNAIIVQISPAETNSVSVVTHENIFQYLDISQSDKTLSVRLKAGNYTNSDVKVTLTMPELIGLKLSGASKGDLQGFKSSNDFDLSVSGASQLNLDIEAARTKLDISGASRVSGQLKVLEAGLDLSGASRCEISGSANNATFDVSGASQALNKDFQIQNADISVSGASKVVITASSTLNVDATGASTLEYFGNPVLNKVNVNGASRLNHQ